MQNRITEAETTTSSPAIAKQVLAAVFRPKNGYELLAAMKEHKDCEIADSHAWIAAKLLEDHLQGSFSFKLSKWNKGWAGFSRW